MNQIIKTVLICMLLSLNNTNSVDKSFLQAKKNVDMVFAALFSSNILDMSEEDMETAVSILRDSAVHGEIDIDDLFSQIKERATKEIIFYEAGKNQKYDYKRLKCGLCALGVTALSVIALHGNYKNIVTIRSNMEIIQQELEALGAKVIKGYSYLVITSLSKCGYENYEFVDR